MLRVLSDPATLFQGMDLKAVKARPQPHAQTAKVQSNGTHNSPKLAEIPASSPRETVTQNVVWAYHRTFIIQP